MNALEAQKELVQFLLNRLKACARESIAYHGVLMNAPEENRALARKMMEHYRDSPEVRNRVKVQFQDLDLLIQRVSEGVQEEEFRKLLEQCDPTGPVN